MTDIQHDIEMLVSLARVDVAARDCNAELGKIPARVAGIDRKTAAIDGRGEAEEKKLESLKKERRGLEVAVEDHEAKINESKTKLTQVKTNHEYTAALKEIDTLKEAIDSEEERLLKLMDELEEFEPRQATEMNRIGEERSALEAEKKGLLEREANLKAELLQLAGEKPGFLAGLSNPLKRQYDRLLARYGDVAVVPISRDFCGGCGTQVPPQVGVEIRTNNQLINCPSCGRILVSYDA